MTTILRFIGSVGVLLGIGGVIAYSLMPEELWLVTLLEGLALICLTGFFVIHFETLKAVSTRRSTRLGANSMLIIFLFVAILVIVNFLAARHAKRWDLSEMQQFTLAPQTFEILRTLPRQVDITVFAELGSPAFRSYQDLLDAYEQASGMLEVKYVDPDREPALARRYGISRRGTVVVESGPQSTRVGAPSEAEMTSALIRVSRDTRKRVVFLQGHGERDMSDKNPDGYSLAEEALLKQGYDVQVLTLLREVEMPESTSVLVVAGPTLPVTNQEKKHIARYVAGGGRVLVLVDPDTNHGLEDLVRAWGVEIGPGVLVDPKDRLPQGDLTALMVTTFTENEVLRDFRLPVLLPFSRDIRPDSSPTHPDTEGAAAWEFAPLARTSARSWAETDLDSVRNRVLTFDAKDDVRGPLSVAAALEPPAEPGAEQPRAAVVVVGNSSFASNAFVNFPGNTDFFLHLIGWLAREDALVSITPKVSGFRPFIPSPAQERIIFYVQVLLVPSAILVAGIMIRRQRRKL